MYPSEDTPAFDVLLALAHKKEVALSRRLVARAGLSEHAALLRILTAAAQDQTLAALLAARRAAHANRDEALAVRALHRADKRRAADEQRRMRHDAGFDADVWRAHFDGSAHPNPGRLGIGATLTGPGEIDIAICRRAGHGDSSEAEFSALLAVLAAARDAGAARLAVFGDSRVVIDDVNHAFGRNGAAGAVRFAPQRAQTLALLAHFAEVTLIWIPRKKNAIADALSQRAIGYDDAPAPGLEEAHG